MKTLNTIYLWLMLAACVLALAGCVEEKVSGTGEGGNISVKMNVNARGGSDIQAEMENAVKSLRVYAFIGQKQIGYYRGTTGLNPDAGGKISFWMDLELPPYSALVQDVWFYLVANEDAMLRPSATLREDMTRDELEKFYFGEINARGYGAVPMAVKQSQKIALSHFYHTIFQEDIRMAITAAVVNELRQATGCGLMDCKKALIECEGDMEKAVMYLGFH